MESGCKEHLLRRKDSRITSGSLSELSYQSSRSAKLWHDPKTLELHFFWDFYPATLDRFINDLTRVINVNMLLDN
jgi:hypothetical protein